MDIVHADRYARAIVVGVVLAFLTVGASACSLIPGLDSSSEPAGVEYSHVDPCVPTFGSGVQSVGMSNSGSLLYLSNKRPATLPEDASWSSDEDMAVYAIRETQGADGSDVVTEAYAVAIVWPWTTPDSDKIQGVSVDDLGRPTPEDPVVLAERMVDLQLAGVGDRFILSVSRGTTTQGLAKLYTGLVPPDDRVLAPGDGLEIVRVNSFEVTEGVHTYLLSPDGTKLAATVAPLGELRFYDFASEQPIVYSADGDGDLVITNELPDPPTNLGVMRQPAITLPGTSRMAWSPGGDVLAVANTDSVGVTGVWLIDVATGDYELVRSFKQSTVPFVQWSADGQSLFVLNTKITSSSGSSFGNSEVRRIAAREGGDDIGDAWQLVQKDWYSTAPANLTGYGDDSRFVFAWEGQLWLLETPAAGSGSATYGPITDQPPDITALPGNLAGTIDVAQQLDTVAFRAMVNKSVQVGQRVYASAAPDCPLAPPPAADDAAAAPAEGEDEAQPAEAEEGAGEEAAEQAPAESADEGEAEAETETEAETEGEAESETEGDAEGETEGDAEGEDSDEG